MKQVSDLKVGDRARICGFQGDKSYRQKLLSMGLVPGTEFILRRRAPLGDPVEIEIRGYGLSLRQGEAEALKIEKITQN